MIGAIVSDKGVDVCTARVLVADDDPAMLDVLRRLLESADFAVDCVSDAASAREKLAQEQFDVLMTDIYMPGNESLDLLSAPELGTTPVVLITGHPTVETAVLALRLAAVDYITKPIEPARVVESVRAALQKGKAMKAVVAARAELTDLSSLFQSLRDSFKESGLGKVAATLNEDGGVPRPPGLTMDEWLCMSKREREIVHQVASGSGTADIAKLLYISPHTVRSHLKAVYRKLELSTRSELLRKVRGIDKRNKPPAK